MHADLLAKALSAIEPETTLEEFQAVSGIAGRSVARGVIDFLASSGIGSVSKGSIRFSETDRLHAAAIALQLGCDIEQVSERLSWKDFEKLTSHVLSSLGYQTQTNLRLTKPRMEIDVVGVSSGFAIAVDCKHWGRSSPSSLAAFAKKQAARSERLLKRNKISQAVPVIMTLHASTTSFVAGVPVVPVQKFRSFVMDVKGFLPEIYVAG